MTSPNSASPSFTVTTEGSLDDQTIFLFVAFSGNIVASIVAGKSSVLCKIAGVTVIRSTLIGSVSYVLSCIAEQGNDWRSHIGLVFGS